MIKPAEIFLTLAFVFVFYLSNVTGQTAAHLSRPTSNESVFLRSVNVYKGNHQWQMKRANAEIEGGEISMPAYRAAGWESAIVPGTVLNSLVVNGKYPEPYYGDNNRKTRKLIPDIADTGIDFYNYWFRTEFSIPRSFKGKRIWLKFHGINYRCDIWLNGKNLGKMAGMFNAQSFDITAIVNRKGKNVLAVDVLPVDVPGSNHKPGQPRTGAVGENHNGGSGEIGQNVTMLMSAGWDFTVPDGIRDRNTGIWRDVELYATGDVVLENAFVQTKLPLPDTTSSKQTVSVEVKNVTNEIQKGVLTGDILENGITFSKAVNLSPYETKTVVFTPEEYSALNLKNPKLWWPINKGNQHLYTLSLKFSKSRKKVHHQLNTRFGIREISSDQQTPDKSRRFLVNGHPVFIRGTNWVPEAMLRNNEERTYAELRYTKQAGLNFIRLWGGGIAESDYFYQLCDEMGFMVWSEFWITGDTHFPKDTALYFKNLKSTVKRVRSHASSAYYVSANESTEIKGAGALIHQLDRTIGYQVQSECCGIHDGSPYRYENPMQYFENTASVRGSRVDGFNPEYGTPNVPIVESLRKMMPERDLWPIVDSVGNYLDGNGFHQVNTKYRQAVNEFGPSSSIEEYAKKAQFVGAMNYRAIWEVWNYNKFKYGDRFASGFLFWYHNSPVPQTASRLYDWYLEPTAALYYSQNGLQPLHPQFDYLKNTVSVYNDFRREFKNYNIEASVYDFDAKRISSQSAKINIPADGVVNDALKVNFPEEITQVHFIQLKLKDDAGKEIATSFYWRSKDAYKGAWTISGPAVSGFQDISNLPRIQLQQSGEKQWSEGRLLVKVQIKNPSNTLSFFTQLKIQNEKGENINPAFYSDNFFSLLPGEEKEVRIEFLTDENKKIRLVTDAFNADTVTLDL